MGIERERERERQRERERELLIYRVPRLKTKTSLMRGLTFLNLTVVAA